MSFITNVLQTLFGQKAQRDRDLIRFAKNEFKNDWQWAYNHLKYDHKLPRSMHDK